MTYPITRRFAIAAAASLGLLSAAPAAAEGWTPERPVEMVIMAGTGGGADRLARLFQSIIQKENLSTMPILPVNKGGGSGAEALRYLADNEGENHLIMATLNSYYTTPLRNDIGVDIEEFTPIARMALDTFVLWVNADSDIETLDDYVAAVQASGGTWKMGGTGTGQEDSLVTAMLENEFGISVTYVPFSGGGDVARNLVGGHIDSSVNNPSEALGFFQAGQVRPIAAFTPERIPALPDTPTMGELGHDLVYWMQRSFVAPAGMAPEAVAYYTEMFENLSASEEWQTYTAEKALMADFLTGEELQAYFLEEREKHADLLNTMGEGS
ncbi:tripartite tricarboxylate transporter substrate binding protein [Cognatiyoonia sp. IB215446]|uniref:Bug family tripartite tricarboxylate transporter substrate binding protein n=1 Tax=Cognatiyoonia sp. IB215446 TaxID=3097355 RepID=UPI002A0AF6CB|nr:tripartite tricarboxylate transporter substrate binding protein [Cognatiyoonia sp. IB215446]MDX8347471.1 tripartite tricarboxylate transporter substrate binding protein [Cognatiyoonia sp. IB215446]